MSAVQLGLGASTASMSTGSQTVKTDPLPYSLSTISSPPIKRQNLRLSAKPSPVPPYFLEIDTSAWVKAWNNLETCSGVIPIPESLMRKTTYSLAERDSVEPWI